MYCQPRVGGVQGHTKIGAVALDSRLRGNDEESLMLLK
jgi:hypothetical protein